MTEDPEDVRESAPARVAHRVAVARSGRSGSPWSSSWRAVSLATAGRRRPTGSPPASVTFQARPAWPGGQPGHAARAGRRALAAHAPHAARRRHGLPPAGADGRPAGRRAWSRTCPGWRAARATRSALPAEPGRRGCSWWAPRPGCSSRVPRTTRGGCSGAPSAAPPSALLLGSGPCRSRATRPSTARRPSVPRDLPPNVPRVLPLVRALSTGGDQSDHLRGLQDFVDGLEAVAMQLTVTPRRPARAPTSCACCSSATSTTTSSARAPPRGSRPAAASRWTACSSPATSPTGGARRRRSSSCARSGTSAAPGAACRRQPRGRAGAPRLSPRRLPRPRTGRGRRRRGSVFGASDPVASEPRSTPTSPRSRPPPSHGSRHCGALADPRPQVAAGARPAPGGGHDRRGAGGRGAADGGLRQRPRRRREPRRRRRAGGRGDRRRLRVRGHRRGVADAGVRLEPAASRATCTRSSSSTSRARRRRSSSA